VTAREPRRPLLWLGAGALTGSVATLALVTSVVALAERGTPADALGPPTFVDVSDSAGVDHVYDGDFDFFVGGGVAVLDCDGDTRPDLFLAGGSNPATLVRNRSRAGGGLSFERVPSPVTDLTAVTGAYPLDLDDDGHLDLVVLRHGENVVLRGVGDCRFERVNEAWGIRGGEEWTVGFSATWEEGQVRPTLAFGNYLRVADSGERLGCADHALLRPDGYAYRVPVALAPGWCTLSILFSDWSGTGRTDLRMTNDRHYYRDGEEQLWRMAAGEEPRPYTADEGWERMQIWGMGIASHDLTGDGAPEVLLTSQGDNKLQTLSDTTGRPAYRDMAFAAGATAHRPYAGDVDLPSTAWHPEFDDVNNDSFVDLYISKGNVETQPDHAADDPNNLLLGGPEGMFTEAAPQAGITSFASTRGAALTDLDGDGLLDLVEVNRRRPVTVWHNLGSGTSGTPVARGDWIGVELAQAPPNRRAVGALIEVRVGNRVLSKEATVGGGHAGGDAGPIHVGLGRAADVEIRVRWPDGEVGPWMNTPTNRVVTVERDPARVVSRETATSPGG
jgi:enediyne biosynthesis protein E4